MCCVRACAAVLLAASTMFFCPGDAAAQNATSRDGKRFLFFSGFDLWRHGSFSHGGILWAPGGIDRDGFTFKLLVGGGQYEYLSGALGNAKVSGRQLLAFALPGWRFTIGKMIATVFAGLDVQRHRLTPDDPAGGLRGTMTGFRTGIEFWMEPDADTMIAGDFSFSTVGPSLSARMAAGWRVFGRFYLGPEIAAFAGDDSYEQFRAGLHITGLKTGDYEWSGALGWSDDSDDRNGFYGRIGLLFRR